MALVFALVTGPVEELGHKVAQHDRHIALLVEHVQRLLTAAPV